MPVWPSGSSKAPTAAYVTNETTGAFPVPSEEEEEARSAPDEAAEAAADEDELLASGETAVAGLSRTIKRMPLLGKVNSTTRFSRAAAKAAARAAPGSVMTVGEGEGEGVGAVVFAALAAADDDAAGSSVAAESKAARRVVFIVFSSQLLLLAARQMCACRGLLLCREHGRCEGKGLLWGRCGIGGDDDEEDDAGSDAATLVMARMPFITLGGPLEIKRALTLLCREPLAKKEAKGRISRKLAAISSRERSIWN